MKKIIILITSVVITLGMGITAFASDETTLKDQAGITPDSILYPIDTAIDNLKVSLSSSDESKSNTLSNIAEERLGEGEVMINENKTDLADKAIDDYKNVIDEAENKIENLINKTDNQDELKKLEDVENKVINTQKTSIDVLNKLQGKLPDKAKAKIAKVIEMQTAKNTAILEMKKERATCNKAKKEYNDAKAALEQAKKTGDTAAIAAAENLLQQKQEALNTKVGNPNKKEKSNKTSKNNDETQANNQEDTSNTTSTKTTTSDSIVTKNSINNRPLSIPNSKSISTEKDTETEGAKPSVSTETKKESASDNKNKQSSKAKVNNENQKMEH